MWWLCLYLYFIVNLYNSEIVKLPAVTGCIEMTCSTAPTERQPWGCGNERQQPLVKLLHIYAYICISSSRLYFSEDSLPWPCEVLTALVWWPASHCPEDSWNCLASQEALVSTGGNVRSPSWASAVRLCKCFPLTAQKLL